MTFILVKHFYYNKGSDSEPSYPSTKFTTAPGDRTIVASLGDKVIVDENTIQLANGSGNTAITKSQTRQLQLLHLQ